MSGVTKHIFDQEVRDILSMWDCEIKTIQPLLPKEYSKSDIIALLKEFYPYPCIPFTRTEDADVSELTSKSLTYPCVIRV